MPSLPLAALVTWTSWPWVPVLVPWSPLSVTHSVPSGARRMRSGWYTESSSKRGVKPPPTSKRNEYLVGTGE